MLNRHLYSATYLNRGEFPLKHNIKYVNSGWSGDLRQ